MARRYLRGSFGWIEILRAQIRVSRLCVVVNRSFKSRFARSGYPEPNRAPPAVKATEHRPASALALTAKNRGPLPRVSGIGGVAGDAGL